MKEPLYNSKFYENRNLETQYSATVIAEIILKFVAVESVIDIGCGVGTWLQAFKSKNPEIHIVGVDGSYVDRRYMTIQEGEFYPRDLEKPVSFEEKFDLALSLEVAEHLSPYRAKGFVEDLCKLSDNVLFSAATVGQGGVGHINEQRLSYWIGLFVDKGYTMYDVIRPEIWTDKKIPWWYRQNIVFFSKKDIKDSHKKVIDIIHPDVYERVVIELEGLKSSKLFKTYNYLMGIFKRRSQ